MPFFFLRASGCIVCKAKYEREEFSADPLFHFNCLHYKGPHLFLTGAKVFFSAINYPDVPRNHSQSGNAGRSRPPLASVRADADAFVEALTSSKGEKIQASFVFPLQFCVFSPPAPPAPPVSAPAPLSRSRALN